MRKRPISVNLLAEIRRSGRSEKTVRIFLHDLCGELSESMLNWANHSLGVAELMAQLAPEDEKDMWYTTGLLYRLSELREEGVERGCIFQASLMRKAGFSPVSVSCIQGLGRPGDPREWPHMKAALIYADTHVSEKGDLLRTDECCMIKKNRGNAGDDCTDCMYARYALSKHKDINFYESEIEKCRNRLAAIRKKTAMRSAAEAPFGGKEAIAYD